MPGRTQGTQFEIAGNRANVGHRGARIKSELDAGHVVGNRIADHGGRSQPSHRQARRILPSINDYDPTTRRMDVDAPCPRCPFCGRPMKFRFNELSTLQTFDCTGCGVLGIAVPVLARD
jgi:hypothetical protein